MCWLNFTAIRYRFFLMFHKKFGTGAAMGLMASLAGDILFLSLFYFIFWSWFIVLNIRFKRDKSTQMINGHTNYTHSDIDQCWVERSAKQMSPSWGLNNMWMQFLQLCHHNVNTVRWNILYMCCYELRCSLSLWEWWIDRKLIGDWELCILLYCLCLETNHVIGKDI